MLTLTGYAPTLTFTEGLESLTFRTPDGASLDADKAFVYHVPAQSEVETSTQGQDGAAPPGTLVLSEFANEDTEYRLVSRFGLPDGSALIVGGHYSLALLHRLILPSDDSADVPDLPCSEDSDVGTVVEGSSVSGLVKQVISTQMGVLLPGSETSVWTFSPASNVEVNVSTGTTPEDLARIVYALGEAWDHAEQQVQGEDTVIAFGDFSTSEEEISEMVDEMRPMAAEYEEFVRGTA
jgi:hypothetical protein